MTNMTDRKCYYVREYSRENDTLAFAWLVKEAAPKGKGFVAAHIPRNLSTVLRGVIPDELVRKLYSKGRFIDSKGLEIVRVTKSKLPLKGEGCPMVVYHPSMELLKKVDTIEGISKILAVLITRKEI